MDLTTPRANATLLIDFENIFYHFSRTGLAPASTDVCEPVIAWLRKLSAHIGEIENIVSQGAYADFERIPEDVQTALYLLGADTYHVVGTDHKNAADMKLCIDAMEILYTRRDIGTFVLVAGDRDYIPLIRHLRKQGKIVRVVGFSGSVAGDLITTVGSENFLEGQQFLPPALVKPEAKPAVKSSKLAASTPVKAAKPSIASELIPEPNDNDRLALKLIFQHFSGKSEVWLTPYLHRLRAELPQLAEFERREIINRLTAMGAITVEKRPGEPNPFSVLTLNWNHPLVQQGNTGAGK